MVKSDEGVQVVVSQAYIEGPYRRKEEIDLKAVKQEITRLEKELTAVRAKMDGYLKELGV